jgi:hypothetical protein
MGCRHAIGAPPQPDRVKLPSWRPSIAFPLIGFDAGTPKRDRNCQMTGLKEALRAVSGPGADPDGG